MYAVPVVNSILRNWPVVCSNKKAKNVSIDHICNSNYHQRGTNFMILSIVYLCLTTWNVGIIKHYFVFFSILNYEIAIS